MKKTRRTQKKTNLGDDQNYNKIYYTFGKKSYAETYNYGQMFVIAKKNDAAITSMEIQRRAWYLDIVGQTECTSPGFCGFALRGLEPRDPGDRKGIEFYPFFGWNLHVFFLASTLQFRH